MSATPMKLTFPGHSGAELAARLELPTGTAKAFALFAHCFTCGKDLSVSRKMSEALTREGIAVLRFDFTGLGGSGGDFASTNFTSNLSDLVSAAAYLRDHYQAPSLLIGHSLGGTAMLAVADQIPEAKAIATIGAPADPSHLLQHFEQDLSNAETDTETEFNLGPRRFSVKQQFFADLQQQDVIHKIKNLKRALLILHAPLDNIVSIDNATEIFIAAKHPKSFCSLDSADHLLSNEEDAAYAAQIIAAWSRRYIGHNQIQEQAQNEAGFITIRETGLGNYQNQIQAGPHRFIADEPPNVGGLGTGPSPYELLSAALGACTSITMRMYANRKKYPLDRITIKVSHKKIHGEDTTAESKIDHFFRDIHLEGNLSDEEKAKILGIADKCPVHRTLEKGAQILTNEV
ncbi:MAG: bifunctional alpha/beta hydrolase/OsmC family protein [bacterium]